MYKLVIEYAQSDLTHWEQSALTGRVSEWLSNYEVYGCQCGKNVIMFDTDRMRSDAWMWLCDQAQVAGLRLG